MLQFFGGLCWAWDNFMQNICWRVFFFWSRYVGGFFLFVGPYTHAGMGRRAAWDRHTLASWKWKACQILGGQVNSPCKALSGSHKFYFRSYSILFFLVNRSYSILNIFFGFLCFLVNWISFFFLVKGQLDFLTHTHRGWLIRPKETRAQFYSLISYALISKFLLKS